MHRMEPELLRWFGIEIRGSKMRAVWAYGINCPRRLRTHYCTFDFDWRRSSSRILSSPLLPLLLLNFGIIDGIIHDWMAEVREVDSDLVCSSRDWLTEHTTRFSIISAAEHSKFGFRMRPKSLAFAVSCRHCARAAGFPFSGLLLLLLPFHIHRFIIAI